MQRNAALILTFIFASILLVFVVGPADGTWQLYAKEVASNKKLYSELGLNQQPLFVLVNLISAKVSDSILYQKWIFLIIAYAYCLFIFKISTYRQNNLKSHIVAVTVFAIAIQFEAYRFDDYHALSDLFILISYYSTVLLLDKKISFRRFCTLSIYITTIACLTRINEGLCIFAACAAIAIFKREEEKIDFRLIGFHSLIAILLTLGLIVFVLGDSPYSWFNETFVKAKDAKGGGSIYLTPIILIRECLVFLYGFKYSTNITISITPACALYSIFSSIILIIFYKSKKYTKHWLMVFPAFYFMTSVLSSGGGFYGLYFGSALTLLTFHICYFDKNETKKINFIFCTVLLIIALQGLIHKIKSPYSWHDYKLDKIGRHYLIKYDVKGNPYVISEKLALMMDPVCQMTKNEPSLLSMPYSFANYYCDVPVWHGVIQSFFDTSTKSTINKIMSGLKSDPPKFILYQRQLINLRNHEVIFNHGNPLPHRQLDDFIMDKINNGEWIVVYSSNAYSPSDWMLIDTQPKLKVQSN